MTDSSPNAPLGEISAWEIRVSNGTSQITRPAEEDEESLANHPLWPELLANLEKNRLADLARDAAEYAE